MKIKLLIVTVIILIASAFTVIINVDWKVKEGYIVKVFRNDHEEFPIYLKGLKANISFDKENPEKSNISVSLDATTIEAPNESMTAHAKEPNVLDTDKFPMINFESTAIAKKENGYEATGNLTLKGITKEIKLPFIFERDTFSGSFAISAIDFNITRKGAVPSGLIKIELIVPVTK